MSDNYSPRKGDQVRVVLEGEVVRATKVGFDIVAEDGIEGNCIIPSASHVVSVEKLGPKLPTAPGSVIRDVGFEFFLTESGWRSATDSLYRADDARFSSRTEVIYDAGASDV